MVKDVAFIAYSVKDVPRAKAFYRDVVGLKVSEADSTERWVEFNVGNTTFGIGDGAAIGITPGSQFAAAFEVDDIDAMHELLKKKGVAVSDVFAGPACKSAFVTDPDGNRFAIHQRTAQ